MRSEVELRRTGCYGFCERGPVVVVEPENICYLDVRPKDVAEIVAEDARRATSRSSGCSSRTVTAGASASSPTSPSTATRRACCSTPTCSIDPKSIDDYIAIGGYQALAKALFEMTPAEIVDVVKKSSLRGRGGGGFPTGAKWETTRNAPGEPKYVVVNADEGDPGAFMDRSLLEGNPHSVLEGLIIGAYAIGAHQGFIYVRQEYPLAVENIRTAHGAGAENAACWARTSSARGSRLRRGPCTAAPAPSSRASRAPS